MNIIDKQILTTIQKEFPVCQQPFKTLGDKFGLSESETIIKFEFFKNELKILRTISPIFNPTKLGYSSVLVAFHLMDHQLPDISEKINNLSSVSHNYLRDCYYNLWFTCTVPVKFDIEFMIKAFCKNNNVNEYFLLPAKRMFNREVIFDLANERLERFPCKINKATESIYECTTLDKKIITELQINLPLVSHPFKVIAESVGISELVLIDHILGYIDKSVIKRYCASVNHLKTPFKYNALVAWYIENTLIEDIGKLFISLDFVSHCYERQSYPQWPYNLYTMVHSVSEKDLDLKLCHMNEISNQSSCQVLRTIKELKKQRVKYNF